MFILLMDGVYLIHLIMLLASCHLEIVELIVRQLSGYQCSPSVCNCSDER